MAINKIFAGININIPGGSGYIFRKAPEYVTSWSNILPADTAEILVQALYALNNTFDAYSYLDASAIRKVDMAEDQRVLRVMFKRRKGVETRDQN